MQNLSHQTGRFRSWCGIGAVLAMKVSMPVHAEDESSLPLEKLGSPSSVVQFSAQDVWSVAAIAAVLVLVLLGLLLASWRREHEQQRFSLSILNSLGHGVFQTDARGVCHYINPSALLMLQVRADEVLGRSPHTVFHHHFSNGQVYPIEECPVWQTLHDGQPRQSEESFYRKNGELFPAEVLSAPMRRGDKVEGVVVIFSDISARKVMEAQLLELATKDVLTDLNNRRAFLQRLNEQLARVRRFGESSCVIMLDCDHFKLVNDHYGHAVGDEVLRGLAVIMRQNMRQTDVLGRLGGEEFAILLNDASLESALEWAERLRLLAESHEYHSGEASFIVTISLGCTQISADDDENSVLLRADRALYQAKERGRNRVEMM